MAKHDVKMERLQEWNVYRDDTAETAAAKIYNHAESFSMRARDWYWASIASKRTMSLAIRAVSFFLLLSGAVLPILAGLGGNADDRLLSTQLGVAALVFAGLIHNGDRVFGWSSGWLRYMTTVTAMEAVTRTFELEWAKYIINKGAPLDENDKRPMFELATQMEQAIAKLQSDETDKWVAEFNGGLAVLNDLIKSQRESAERTAEAARATVTARDEAAASREKAKGPGSIELTVVQKAPLDLKIGLDDEQETEFSGGIWAKRDVAPGHHTVQVRTMPGAKTYQKIAEVPPGGVARLELSIP
jgi:hypothetical protein